jgi:hypothetical protein
MTPEETKAAAQVMLAAEYDAEGKCINIESTEVKYEYWSDNKTPLWHWATRKYRIKPKPELKKGQIIEVSDDKSMWFLRRFSLWASDGRVFAYDGSIREKHDCVWKHWRLPE